MIGITEYIRLTLADGREVTGRVARDERVDPQSVAGLYRYEVRSKDDDWDEPAELSERVIVNFWGTVITDEPIAGADKGFIAIKDWYFEGWANHANDCLMERFSEADCADRWEFVFNYWENLKTDKENLSTFETYIKELGK